MSTSTPEQTTENHPHEQQEQQQEQQPSDTNSPPLSDPIPDKDQLREELIKELEFIFSKEYLTADPYMRSQMNGDNYLPITVVAELPRVKSLTSDMELILTALQSTDQVVVDVEKQMVKPVVKLVQRNTLILRDIPETTKEEEIRALFVGNEKLLESIDEMKPELADTYFIKFKDEDVTLEAYTYLREKVTFGGKPIQARVKSDLLKSYYYPGTRQQQTTSFDSAQYDATLNPYWNGGYEAVKGFNLPDGTYQRNERGGRTGGRFGNNRRGRKELNRKEGGRGRRGGRGGKKGNPPKGETRRLNANNNTISMLPSQWPPLPTTQDKKGGYQEDFQQYDQDSVTKIISSLKDEIKPTFENQCNAILENGYHSELEISKPVPTNAKVEWLDAPRKGSMTKRGRGGSTGNKKNNNNNNSNTNTNNNESNKPNENEPSHTSTPANNMGPWPSVNSSTVKHPPTNQPKNKQQQQPNNKPKKSIKNLKPKQQYQQKKKPNQQEVTQNKNQEVTQNKHQEVTQNKNQEVTQNLHQEVTQNKHQQTNDVTSTGNEVKS